MSCIGSFNHFKRFDPYLNLSWFEMDKETVERKRFSVSVSVDADPKRSSILNFLQMTYENFE